jgi:hypothetical protein
LNDISTLHFVGLFLVPGNSGVGGNESADRLATDGTVLLDQSLPSGSPIEQKEKRLDRQSEFGNVTRDRLEK